MQRISRRSFVGDASALALGTNSWLRAFAPASGNEQLLLVGTQTAEPSTSKGICHAALKSRIDGLYLSPLSAFLLHIHCTEITDVCIQITDGVLEKVCPPFECCHTALNSRNDACLFSILFRDFTALSLHSNAGLLHLKPGRSFYQSLSGT